MPTFSSANEVIKNWMLEIEFWRNFVGNGKCMNLAHCLFFCFVKRIQASSRFSADHIYTNQRLSPPQLSCSNGNIVDSFDLLYIFNSSPEHGN